MAEKAKKKPQGSVRAKTTVKKTSAKKPAADRRSKLVGELSGLLNQIDEEGLLFLKKQASILIHNQTVNEINETREKKSPAKKPEKKGQPAKPAPGSPVYTEQVGAKNFVIVVGNHRIFMTVDELKELVRICHRADDLKTAAAACFIWFKKERSDFLSETGIGHPLDKKMAELVLHLTEHYSAG